MFHIKDYGAIGDGNTFDTEAIHRALQACAEAGGGTIVFDAGTYLTGPFELASNMTLLVETGARIVGSPRIEDYASISAAERRKGLIFAKHASSIVICGGGTIDFNGAHFMQMDKAHPCTGCDRQWTRQGEQYMTMEGVEDGPVAKLDRPGFSLQFLHCNNIILRDITLVNSPHWTVRLGSCTNVVIDGTKILNDLLVPNSDGIHLTTCRKVRIANCLIEAGDDCIAITGYDNLQDKTEQIQVTNSTLHSRSSGIRLGIIGEIENCIFQNLSIYGNRGIGVFLRQEESIKNVLFSDIVIKTWLHSGNWWGKGEPIHISALRDGQPAYLGTIRNISFRNIRSESENGIVVYGCEESMIENISFENLHLTIVPSKLADRYGGNFDLRPSDDPRLALFAHAASGLYARHIRGLNLHNITIDWAETPPEYFLHALQCEQSEQIVIDGLNARQPQLESEHAAIVLNDIRTITIRNCTTTSGTTTFLAYERLEQAKFFVGNDLSEARIVSHPVDLPFILHSNIMPKQ